MPPILPATYHLCMCIWGESPHFRFEYEEVLLLLLLLGLRAGALPVACLPAISSANGLGWDQSKYVVCAPGWSGAGSFQSQNKSK